MTTLRNKFRSRPLLAAAAVAGSLSFAPAAQAVTVIPTPASSMSEGLPWHFRFETPSVKEKVAPGSSIAIYASYDGVFDPAVDPHVATATFTDLLTYTSIQVQVDDRVANPDRQHIWTFFYVPSPGIELTATSHAVSVSDDDTYKQGFLGGSVRLKGRTFHTSYTFMEPQASGWLRIKLGKKLIGKKKIHNKTDAGGRTVKVRIRIGPKHYRSLRKRKKVTVEFKGSSAVRDLNVSATYKFRR